jgi:hypothetical protein
MIQENAMRNGFSLRAQRGSALVLSIIVLLAIFAISAAFMVHSQIRAKNANETLLGVQALGVAESGALLHIQKLNRRLNNPSAPAPETTLTSAFADNSATYRLWTDDLGTNGKDDDGNGEKDESNEANFMRLWVEGWAGGVWDGTASKYRGGVKRTLEVILTHREGGVFWNAIYAGNASGTADFTMTFNGVGGKNDKVKGDIYSGGNLKTTGDAQLLDEAGTAGADRVMYAGTLDTTGATQAQPPGFVNGTQPGLDIASMKYDDKADAYTKYLSGIADPDYDPNFINVTSELDKNGTSGILAVGGSTTASGCGVAEKQITDADNPAHIFRLNPDDNGASAGQRVNSYSGMSTVKNDYFLEDATQKPGAGSAGGNWLGSDGGQRIKVNPNGNNKVYYIDGNLWLSNSPAYSFQFLNNTGGDMKITIIVKGNVYLTDNLLYDKTKQNDALAIIAINDQAYPSATPADVANPAHPAYKSTAVTYQDRVNAARDWNKVNGSGNIFFGDPGGGTTERFESFLFAENNFYDNNLGAAGTNLTNIYGNMTAANHIEITRNPANYKPMDVTFDPRIRNGSVTLPGLPGNLTAAAKNWKIASWRQVYQKDPSIP